MTKVLIVDDQKHVLNALELLFEIEAIETICVDSKKKALQALKNEDIGVVIQDMNFTRATTSGEEGIELFAAIRKSHPDISVILMTAWGSLETAVELVKQGADDYLQKPWNDTELVRKTRNLLQATKISSNDKFAGSAKENLCGLVFESATMQALVRLTLKVGAADISVMITGANGAGKEKVAEIVHANSNRRDKQFVKVNVGALPDELFSAELFGAEAGAYTGSKGRRIGRFEDADGGTLFLDEIGNLSMDSQAKLLRALENGEFERLGSNSTRKADVRVIAATNVEMGKAISEGRFREDLYYRLAVIELNVPSLSERRDDIPLLAKFFLETNSKFGERAASPRFSEHCLETMCQYTWPGNVRELQNRVKRALLVREGDCLQACDLDLEETPTSNGGCASQQERPSLESRPIDRDSFDAAERETLERALAEADNVVSVAAKALGVSRQALYRRMQRLGIQR